jgi:shikimate dehydrogenase
MTLKQIFLIGNPVEHSLSPIMQNHAFKLLSLPYNYKALKVENLEKEIEELRESAGFNVTIPHKQNIMKYLDWIDDGASKIGAVNTVVNENEKLKGYNTDADGFMEALMEEGVDVKSKRVLVLGAGGAGRAVVYSLVKSGAKVKVWNRSKEKAEALANEFGCECGDREETEIIVNTTSVGMHPNVNETPIDKNLILSDTIVIDIVYNPMKTRLLREAQERGARTMDGVKMLVNQGALSFKLWTGKEAPKEEMERVVRDTFGN